MDKIDVDGEKALLAAIVERAVEDYKIGCIFTKEHLKILKQYREIRKNYLSAISFILSDRFNLFTNIDRDELLDKLESEYDEFFDVCE